MQNNICNCYVSQNDGMTGTTAFTVYSMTVSQLSTNPEMEYFDVKSWNLADWFVAFLHKKRSFSKIILSNRGFPRLKIKRPR